MDLICDTNIWYDISSGLLDPTAIKEQGHKLLATPVSVLEIVSKLDEANFTLRQGAAKAIVNHSDDMTFGPEEHLATLWGLKPQATVDWWANNRAVADAACLAELEAGVVDVAGTQKIKVNISKANEWRTSTYRRFLDNVVAALDKVLPGYGKKWANGKFRQLSDSDKELFRNAVRQPLVKNALLNVTFERAAKAAGLTDRSVPFDAELTLASPLLLAYIDVYSEFMVNSGCHSKPEENDAGDVEMFIYAQNGRKIFTGEKKWNRLAESAGHNSIMFP
jgi:hypothetical protein